MLLRYTDFAAHLYFFVTAFECTRLLVAKWYKCFIDAEFIDTQVIILTQVILSTVSNDISLSILCFQNN